MPSYPPRLLKAYNTTFSLLAVILLSFHVLIARAEEALPQPASALQCLQSCISQLPTEPLDLSGNLRLRSFRGIVQAESDFTLKLRWGDNPQRFDLELRNTNDGTVLERATLIRDTAHLKSVIQRYTPDGQRLPTPKPNDTIAGTDLTWMDLSFEFLWWKDVSFDSDTNTDNKVMGRQCYVIVVRPPVNYPGYGAAKLWIDRSTRFLLRAEHLNQAGEPIRRMWVQKVGKTNGKWMVRDLEIKSPRTQNRTMLWIDSVTTPSHE